jgi:hypothetical protein
MNEQIKAHTETVEGLVELFQNRLITGKEAYEMLDESESFICRTNGGEKLNELTRKVLKARIAFLES